MYLKPGDRIGIVAPSRAIEEDLINFSVEYFEGQGFKVELGKHIFNRHDQFSGTDEQRSSDFQKFIDDPEIKAIVAARGGYGAVRIIDRLNLTPLQQNFKWLVGYSDFTVFHSYLNKQMSLPSIHATMPVNMGETKAGTELSNSTMIMALRGEALTYELPSHALNRNIKHVNAEIVGGNLSMLYSMCGSNASIDTAGKILFIEDLDEYLYHVDRMMMNLKRNGMLNKLAALVVGGMSDMNDNTIPYGKTAEEIILEHCQDYGYPIYFGFSAGHLQQRTYALSA